MKISNDVLGILSKSTVDGQKLFLPPSQLDRKLYTDVNKVLEGIGGKWNRSAKAHIFENNPSDVLDEIINTGEWTDKKKEYQFFETPNQLASEMVSVVKIDYNDVILEPSAGKGRIINYIIKNCKAENVYAVELESENFKYLKENYPSVNVFNGDFLNLTTWFDTISMEFDKIIMNPPFSNGQDVKHIFQAWSLLKNNGTLVSIVSESPFFRENKLSSEFRNWIKENNVRVESLDSGIFKESGTMVKTRLIVVKKNGG